MYSSFVFRITQDVAQRAKTTGPSDSALCRGSCLVLAAIDSHSGSTSLSNWVPVRHPPNPKNHWYNVKRITATAFGPRSPMPLKASRPRLHFTQKRHQLSNGPDTSCSKPLRNAITEIKSRNRYVYSLTSSKSYVSSTVFGSSGSQLHSNFNDSGAA